MTFKKTGAALEELRAQRDTITQQISALKKDKAKLHTTIKSIEKLEGGTGPRGKKSKRTRKQAAVAAG